MTAVAVQSAGAPPDDTWSEVPGLAHGLPQLLYYATLFTMPFFRWRQIGPVKVDWLLVLGLACIVVPCLVASKQLPRSYRSNLWPYFAVFFAINLLSSLISPYREAAFRGMLVLVMDFVFISINLIMITRVGYRRGLLVVVIGCVTLNALLSIAGYFLGVEYFVFQGRGIGGTINANNASLMGVFVMPLCFHWMLRARTVRGKMAALLTMAINILGIVSTESRSGFMVMTVTLGVVVLQSRPRLHPRYAGLAMSGLGIVGLLVVLLTPESYLRRIQTIGEGTAADASTARRSTYVIVALKSFADHPILGTGADTFKQAWYESVEGRRFRQEERAAHNTYLEVLVATGLVGFAVFLALLWRTFANYREAMRLFACKNRPDLASITNGYRLAFASLLLYFFFKSGLDHKMFLLALPLSQIALNLAESEPALPATASDEQPDSRSGRLAQ